MSLGSGFPYPPENGTKLGSLSLAPGSPGKRKRREKNGLGQIVTEARNWVNQGYEIRQSKKRRARPPRSVPARPSRNRMTARMNDGRRNFGACTTSVSIRH